MILNNKSLNRYNQKKLVSTGVNKELNNLRGKINAVKNLASPTVLSKMKDSIPSNETQNGTTNIEDLAESGEKILKNEKIENNKVKTT